MQCPHCAVHIAWAPEFRPFIGTAENGEPWQAEAEFCPDCEKLIVQLVRREAPGHSESWDAGPELERILAFPRASQRSPCPPQVPDAICNDYREACLVLADSPKASAALSRRCLQHILRDSAGVTHGNLAQEIDQVLASGRLLSAVADSLDAVREIGNFAAHPMKSTNTGEVIDVEPGEAEWNLDVIEALMDIYYVQPVPLATKRAALNDKLAQAGKPQLP